MTEALLNVVDGTIIELRPRMLLKRLRAFAYGRGTHAPMRSPLQEVVHVAGVVLGVAILGFGVFAAVVISL